MFLDREIIIIKLYKNMKNQLMKKKKKKKKKKILLLKLNFQKKMNKINKNKKIKKIKKINQKNNMRLLIHNKLLTITKLLNKK